MWIQSIVRALTPQGAAPAPPPAPPPPPPRLPPPPVPPLSPFPPPPDPISVFRSAAQSTVSPRFWDDQGYIVTNYHVIQGAQALEVTLQDQQSFEARVVGAEPRKDIAVLKIDAPPGALKAVRVPRSGATAPRSARRPSPSATPSASTTPSPKAPSAPSAARCRASAASPSAT